MADEGSFSIVAAIMCEEVRKELSFRDTILGAVPDGLAIAAFPAAIRCAFWLSLRAEGLGPGVHTLRLLLTQAGSVTAVVHEFRAQFALNAAPTTGGDGAKTSRGFALGTNSDIIQLPQPATLSLWYALDEREPIHFRDIPFEQMQFVPSPPIPQPPAA